MLKDNLNVKSELEPKRSSSDLELERRIGELIGLFATLQEAVRVSGRGRNQLARYTTGESDPPLLPIAKMAQEKGISLDWIWSGAGPKMLGDRVSDERGEYSKADYALIAPAEGDLVERIAFSKQWLADERLDAEQLALLRIRGNSLVRDVADGDTVLIDERDTGPDADGLYVLRQGERMIIKRFQILVGGDLLISSDSAAYRPEKIGPDERKLVSIIGRIVWVSRRI
jgi:transcriptional regulator with XRE-family HTH domain